MQFLSFQDHNENYDHQKEVDELEWNAGSGPAMNSPSIFAECQVLCHESTNILLLGIKKNYEGGDH